jgi:hypothetical protein
VSAPAKDASKVPLYYDLADPVFEILSRLALEPDDVRSLSITRDEVMVELFLRNERGKKYIDDDSEEVATRRVKYFAKIVRREDSAE